MVTGYHLQIQDFVKGGGGGGCHLPRPDKVRMFCLFIVSSEQPIGQSPTPLICMPVYCVDDVVIVTGIASE